MLLPPLRRDCMSNKGNRLGIVSKKKKMFSFANRDSSEYSIDLSIGKQYKQLSKGTIFCLLTFLI